jgi:hypothetical protein
MAETVITEFCDPKNYINSTGGTFVDAVILEADVDSKLGCCLACFYTENCFTYRWLTFYSQVLSPCVLYALAEAQDFPTGVAGARCPLGLVPGDFLVSQTDPNTQYEYGICAEKAILS